MTDATVVDASVAAAWILEEAFSPAAMAQLGTGEALIAPELLVTEVGNALWKAWRRGEASADQLTGSEVVLDGAVTAWHPLLSLMPHALALARRLNHPIYDCVYLALAQRDGLPLATADRRLARLAEAEGIEVRLIEPAPGAALP